MNKENKKIWDLLRIPFWLGVGVLIGMFIISSLGSVSLEDYSEVVFNHAQCVNDYGDLGLDYLELLNCYQKGLLTCEPLIEKHGVPAVFTQGG